jgi:septum formation inhibitor MinC
MKFSAVKRQLLDDQVESAKSLLSYTTEIERKSELDFNPYLKSELQHLQKYVDQLSIKPKSPYGLYRRTEEEDISYCLHRKHSKSMNTLFEMMKNINKELYRLKKLKQAEKKLEFLEIFQFHQNNNDNKIIQTISNQKQYKLPDSKSPLIPQLSSPKPMYEPVIFQEYIEDEKPPEMSRAMESFLIQQEKERKEKELKQQKQQQEKEQQQQQQQQQQEKETKSLPAGYVPEISSSDKKGQKEREEDKKKD